MIRANLDNGKCQYLVARQNDPQLNLDWIGQCWFLQVKYYTVCSCLFVKFIHFGRSENIYIVFSILENYI